MQKQNSGLRSYMYEYFIYRTITRTGELTGRPILVSQGKHLRHLIGERLRAQGTSIDDPGLQVSQALEAIQGVMNDEVPGYQDLFRPPTTQSKGYRALLGEFTAMTGLSAQGGSTGPSGPRLPVSPFDPRWSGRRTVKLAGSKQLYILDGELETLAGGRAADAHRVVSDQLHLYSLDEDERAVDVGQALTLDDVSGLSELMGRMTSRDYSNIRQWVLDASRDPVSGTYDPSRFMTHEAVSRARAVLDHLAESGVPYTIEKDRRPGQIKARITGTTIDVRLTEVRSNEHWVGRVYDNGQSLYYSTTRKEPGTNRFTHYTPTQDEVIKLVDLAMGRQVDRADGKGVVGAVSQSQTTRWDPRGQQYQQTRTQESYLSGRIMTAVYKDLPGDDGAKVVVRRDLTNRSSQARFFAATPEGVAQATGFIDSAVASARENVRQSLDVEGLVRALQEHPDEAREGTWMPELSGDQDLALVQRAYWDVLRGAQTTLLRPDASREEYSASTAVMRDMDESSDLDGVHDMLAGSVAYTGTPQEKVEAHLEGLLDNQIGSAVPGGAFDPVRVARYMTSEHGQWRNNDDLVAAMRRAGTDPSRLTGSSFYSDVFRDRLIRFDKSSMRMIDQVTDPFTQQMLETVRESLETCAVTPGHIAIDANGVIEWDGYVMRTQSGREERVSGTLGQVFPRGERGEITTRFASGPNAMIVPGYEARVLTQRAGENLTLEERTRLRGYEQVMADAIRYRVTSDVLSGRSRVGEPASLNPVYRGLSDTRHPVDHVERSLEEGMSPEWLTAIMSTEGSRVRYPNALRDGSTIDADYRAGRDPEGTDPTNDSTMDARVLTGGRNVAILTQESDGFFDPVMTSGSTNQGITRYLVQGAVVEADGRITPGDKTDRTALMKMPETELMAYDPFDRQQMTTSNIMQAAAITRPVGTAMMTAGGWTMEDSIVVSRRFAREHQIRGTDGQMRDLVVGDKLSDMHGNKGVISLIVDPDLTPQGAVEAHGSEHMVELFASNPGLDVVMSPFSAVSRFNGGSARELMSGRVEDLKVDGEVKEGGLGQVSFIVTHMAVDAKTKVYDDTAIRQGQGRKASSQLAWALQSQGCDKVLAEMYGGNLGAMTSLREMMLVCGLDIEPDGTLRESHDDLVAGGQRRLISLGEPPLTEKGSLDVRAVRRDLGGLIGRSGGDMELPFPLRMPTGAKTPTATDSTWRLPVLSSHLRSGQDLEDGSSTVHDYTNRYLVIAEQAQRYKHLSNQVATGVLNGEGLRKARGLMAEAVHRAQGAYDGITADIISRRFQGKHNVFKEGVMSARLPRSATAVWTGDPRLDIDEVGMNEQLASRLGVRQGDSVLVWRDPVLRDSGVRYMRVGIDNRLTGVSVNPAMVKCFDGDFDGDSVAVVALQTKEARQQAADRLGVWSNLVDTGHEPAEDGTYPVNMHDGLDLAVVQHEHPELAETMGANAMRANDVAYDLGELQEGVDKGEIDSGEAERARREISRAGRALVDDMSTMYRDMLSRQYGAVLSFKDPASHLRSVREACIETGAKGSESKLRDYARYLGVDPGTMVDQGVTGATREDNQGTMYATAVKSFGTGVAGTFSQRGVRGMRNEAIKEVLELTYPVTQSILQSKHDPDDARRRYELLMGPARDLWRGRVVERSDDGWRTRYEKGRPVVATTQEWIDSFTDFYSSSDGLGVSVNPSNIERVAHLLSQDGRMVDPEDTEEIAQRSSTLDQLAYGGSFQTLHTLAKQGRNLFEGRWDSTFAPAQVQQAVISTEAGLDVQALAMKDTQVVETNRIERRRPTTWAVPVRRPEPRPQVLTYSAYGADRAQAGVVGSDVVHRHDETLEPSL